MIKELQPAIEKKSLWAKNVLKNLPMHSVDIKSNILYDIEQLVSQYYRDCRINIRIIEVYLKKYPTENDIPIDAQKELKKSCHELLNKKYDACHSRVMAYVGEDIRTR